VYLGHIVGGGQLKIDPSKIDVIVNWSKPKNVSEIQSFLGAVQYWRRLISNFSFACLNQCEEQFSVGRKAAKRFRHFEEKDQYRTSISTAESSTTLRDRDRCQRIHYGYNIHAIS
jgi:hypothetical protein